MQVGHQTMRLHLQSHFKSLHVSTSSSILYTCGSNLCPLDLNRMLEAVYYLASMQDDPGQIIQAIAIVADSYIQLQPICKFDWC